MRLSAIVREKGGMKDKLRANIFELLSAGQPIPQTLIDQWNKLTGSFI